MIFFVCLPFLCVCTHCVRYQFALQLHVSWIEDCACYLNLHRVFFWIFSPASHFAIIKFSIRYFSCSKIIIIVCVQVCSTFALVQLGFFFQFVINSTHMYAYIETLIGIQNEKIKWMHLLLQSLLINPPLFWIEDSKSHSNSHILSSFTRIRHSLHSHHTHIHVVQKVSSNMLLKLALEWLWMNFPAIKLHKLHFDRHKMTKKTMKLQLMFALWLRHLPVKCGSRFLVSASV